MTEDAALEAEFARIRSAYPLSDMYELLKARLDEGPDELAVLAGVSFLEEGLRVLLHASLVDSSESRSMVKGRSLAQMRQMAYCMGLLPEETYRDVGILARVRNSLAHSVISRVNDQTVVELLHQLAISQHVRTKMGRPDFPIRGLVNMAVLGLAIDLEYATFTAKHPTVPQGLVTRLIEP